MELYKTNLLTFTVQQNYLQSNFQTIQAVLKQLQQQVTILNNQHESVMQSIIHNKHQIQNVSNKAQKHNSLLHQHKNWIEQLNSQFGGFDSPIVTSDQESNQDIPIVERRQSKRKAREETKNRKSEVRRLTQQNSEKQGGKNSEKSGFQEMIINIKDRIKTLERDSEAKTQEIQQLKKFLTMRRNRDSQLQQRRMSTLTKQFASKISNSRKDIKQSSMMIQLKENENEEKSQKGQSQKDVHTPSVQRSDDELFFMDKDLDLKVEDKLISLCRDFQKMKEVFAQRNRILDAHMKDNQQKVQNIEKNMDILQRSHDMLKYDYDRTNTSFSKTRPLNETHEQKMRRAQERLNDTRVTNKQYYEEKLVELFNQMDFLKGQYFQLQNKLEKQVEDEPDDQKNDRKLKLAHKMLSSQKDNEESMRRQLIMHRHQLKKLKEQFSEFTYGINTGANQVKTILIKPNQNKQDWKSLSTKMQKLKSDVQSGIRQLQGKIVTSNDMIVGLNQLQVGIQECKLLIKKKVDISDFEKTMKRLEARLNNFIMQVYQKQGQENQFDAAMAKQPWFCLSCDSQLKNYTGKVQKPNGNSEKLVGRKVNPESHMVRRNDNGRLPSVLK